MIFYQGNSHFIRVKEVFTWLRYSHVNLFQVNILFLYPLKTPRSSQRKWSIKKVFLKALQDLQKNTYIRVSFLINLRALKETLAQMFFCEICKFLRTSFFYRTPLGDCSWTSGNERFSYIFSGCRKKVQRIGLKQVNTISVSGLQMFQKRSPSFLYKF